MSFTKRLKRAWHVFWAYTGDREPDPAPELLDFGMGDYVTAVRQIESPFYLGKFGETIICIDPLDGLGSAKRFPSPESAVDFGRKHYPDQERYHISAEHIKRLNQSADNFCIVMFKGEKVHGVFSRWEYAYNAVKELMDEFGGKWKADVRENEIHYHSNDYVLTLTRWRVD